MPSKQKINVIVNKPDDETMNELLADALADLVIDKINELPEEKRMPTYEAIMAELRKSVAG